MNQYIKTVIFVLVLLGVGYLLLPYVKDDDGTSLNQEQPTGESSAEGYKTYSSDKLGVEFNYLPDQDKDGEDDTTVTERDNIVFIHRTQEEPQSGQRLEVYDKQPSETLKTAIENRFIANIPREQCFVETVDIPKNESGTFNADLVVGEIGYPLSESQEPLEIAHNCPKEYARTNGLRYFMMSQDRTDKFFYFDIGQYAILGIRDGQDVPWQSTIKLK